MSSSGEALSQGSTNNNNDQNNVDSTSAEIESSSATVSADPPVQQQRQILFGSFLVTTYQSGLFINIISSFFNVTINEN